MAAIDLSLVVANSQAVLDAGYTVLKVYRSTTGLNGPYTEITAVGTRIPIVLGQLIYAYVDVAGDPSYYYKTSFYSAQGNMESAQSDAQQGSGDPALNVISVTDLKTNYLVGLDLTTPQGVPFPDSLYQYYIRAACSWLEHKLDLPIRQQVVCDEKHDYYREDYRQYLYTQLYHYPLLSVQQVRLVLPGNQVAQIFDPSWVHADCQTGVVQIVPGLGVNAMAFGITGAFLPYLSANRYVPDVIRVDYTAGFKTVPADIIELVGKTASFGPLNIAGDLLGGAGIASSSLSLDGLSQSINTTSSPMFAGYGARLTQYNKEIREQIPTLRRYYKGIGMRVA